MGSVRPSVSMSRPATLVRGKLFVVFEYGKDDSVRSVSSWTPSFPSVFGGTESPFTQCLAVCSIKQGRSCLKLKRCKHT